VNRELCKRHVLLLLLAGVLLLAGCRAGPMPTPAVTPTPRSGFAALTPAAGPIAHVRADELYRRLQAGEAIQIVDARAYSQYDAEHIAGAVSIPLAEVAMRAQELARDRLVVFYCA